MKLLLSTGLAAAAVLFSLPLALAAGDSGWYLGGSLGRSQAKDLGSGQIDAAFAALGITSTTSVSDTDTAWNLFAGYQFNKYFAAEGGYLDFGKYDFTSTVTSGGGGTISGDWKAHNWNLAAVGILPITDQLSAFGKLGYARWNADLDVSAVGPGGAAAASTSSSGTKPLYGLGLKYAFTPNWAARAEWTRYRDVGDTSQTGMSNADVWSLGVQYQF